MVIHSSLCLHQVRCSAIVLLGSVHHLLPLRGTGLCRLDGGAQPQTPRPGEARRDVPPFPSTIPYKSSRTFSEGMIG